MIRNKNLFYLIPILILISGCAAGSTTALKDLHKEQYLIEAKVNRLAKDLKAAQAKNKELEKQLQVMAKVIKRYEESRRNKHMANLTYYENGIYADYNGQNSAKKQRSLKEQFSDIKSINSADELHSVAENFRKSGKHAYAVLTYQEFINRFPNDIRVPRAYLKQGIALVDMGKSNEAQFFLEDLVHKFPKSAEAQIALHKLSELK